MQRTVHVARDRHHLTWDAAIPPVATVASGDEILFDLLDASCGQIERTSTAETLRTLDFARLDQVNGPIFVEGAEPGDVLEIAFIEIATADWGWTALIPGFGLLADEFPEPALKIWTLEGGPDATAAFAPGIGVPIAPFCGEIGVAPPPHAGALSTIPPYRHGGNIDTKHVTVGARLFLPVQTHGALFSLGDGHAAQGDGEVCGTAIETPVRATVRLTVRRDLALDGPQLVTPGPLAARTNVAGFRAALGVGPDFTLAARDAIRATIEYLERERGLTRIEAYMLCSVAVDLKICEIVDAPNWVVGAFLPLSIFD